MAIFAYMLSYIHYVGNSLRVGEDLRGVEGVESHDPQRDMVKVTVTGILAEQFL